MFIEDLASETEAWTLSLTSRLRGVYEEISIPDLKYATGYLRELKDAYSFVSTGEWPFDQPIDSSRFSNVMAIGRSEIGPAMTHLSESVIARQKLFEGDDLTLNALGYLANVNVRTLRNAASSNSLKTEKVGGSTYIRAHDAEEWLSERKGYKPTRLKKEKTLAYSVYGAIDNHSTRMIGEEPE